MDNLFVSEGNLPADLDTEYVSAVVGKELTECLKETATHRPPDPIDELAKCLYDQVDAQINYYDKCVELKEMELAQLKIEEERDKRADRVAWLKRAIQETQDHLDDLTGKRNNALETKQSQMKKKRKGKHAKSSKTSQEAVAEEEEVAVTGEEAARQSGVAEITPEAATSWTDS